MREGRDRDLAPRDAQRFERRVDPLAKLDGGAPIEGHGRRFTRRHPLVDEPGDPRHEDGRLARSGRRDAQYGPGRRGRRGALVGGQPREASCDRRMHGRMVVGPGHQTLRGV